MNTRTTRTTYKAPQEAVSAIGAVSGGSLMTGLFWQSIRDAYYDGPVEKGYRPYVPRSRPNGMLFMGAIGVCTYLWLKIYEE